MRNRTNPKKLYGLLEKDMKELKKHLKILNSID